MGSRGLQPLATPGLKPPASVVSATEEYFEAEDALGQWIEERCLLAKAHREGV